MTIVTYILYSPSSTIPVEVVGRYKPLNHPSHCCEGTHDAIREKKDDNFDTVSLANPERGRAKVMSYHLDGT